MTNPYKPIPLILIKLVTQVSPLYNNIPKLVTVTNQGGYMSVYWKPEDKCYYASFTYQGKRCRKKLFTTSKKEADEMLGTIQRQIIAGEYGKKKLPAKKLSDNVIIYIENYAKVNNRGWLQDQHNLENFIKIVGDKLIDQVTNLDIDHYKKVRQKTVKAATVNRALTTISGFFNKMVEYKQLEKNELSFKDIPIAEGDESRDRVPTKTELKSIFDSIHDPEYYLIIETLCLTGLRRADVMALTTDKINFKDDIIQVRQSVSQGKTGNKVTIMMHPVLQKDLNRWITENNIKGKLFKIQARKVSETFKVQCLLLGIPDLHLHDLRHAYATALSATKVGGDSIDPFALRDMLGHKDIQKTLIYTNPADSYKQKFIEAMDIGFLSDRMH